MEIIGKNICKSYLVKESFFKKNVVNVLDNINITIKQGEIIAFMGEEGVGKSTLVKILSGNRELTSGEIIVEDNKSLKDNCAVIENFLEKKLFNNESVYNNLVYFGNKLKISSLDLEKKIVDLKNVLGFEKVINSRISELDKLNLMKVNLAMFMLSGAKVLFVDGALKDIDIISKNIILKDLKRLNKEYKTTIVIASDEIMDIEKICKRVVFIKEGKIILDDSFDNVKNKYWNKKIINITFNKSFNVPKGAFKILENNDYTLVIEVDFSECDFASVINQFDINSIVDININCVSIVGLE